MEVLGVGGLSKFNMLTSAKQIISTKLVICFQA